MEFNEEKCCPIFPSDTNLPPELFVGIILRLEDGRANSSLSFLFNWEMEAVCDYTSLTWFLESLNSCEILFTSAKTPLVFLKYGFLIKLSHSCLDETWLSEPSSSGLSSGLQYFFTYLLRLEVDAICWAGPSSVYCALNFEAILGYECRAYFLPTVT